MRREVCDNPFEKMKPGFMRAFAAQETFNREFLTAVKQSDHH
jgi:hypothetical protein